MEELELLSEQVSESYSVDAEVSSEQSPEVSSTQSIEISSGDTEISSEQIYESSSTKNVETSDTRNQSSEMVAKEEVEKMLKEAEERGYLRGKNEQIEKIMEKPSIFSQQPFSEESGDISELLILKKLRKSRWEF